MATSGAVAALATGLGRESGTALVTPSWTTLVVFTLLLQLVTDFTSYLMHLAQHRVPALWAFHRVHHSALVLNPFSNYREHPIDNLGYAITNGLVVDVL